VDSSILFYFFIYFFVFVHGLQLAHFQFLALCQPIFKKTVKKEEEKKKKKRKKEKNEKLIIHFSVSGSSQHSSVFTTGLLPLASLLSPLASSVSLHHQPLFSIFKLKLLKIFHLEFEG